MQRFVLGNDGRRCRPNHSAESGIETLGPSVRDRATDASIDRVDAIVPVDDARPRPLDKLWHHRYTAVRCRVTKAEEIAADCNVSYRQGNRTVKLLILGCGGFVGSHLLDRLLDRSDIEIEGWDPDNSKIGRHIGHPRFTFHQVSCIDGDELRHLESRLADADVLINLAAICNPSQYNTRPLDVIRVNLFDSYPVVEACARANKWLIYFSTSEVYGRTLSSYMKTEVEDPDLYELRENQTPLIMGPVVNQRWTYACAKQMMERIIFAHHSTTGMPFTFVRPLNFFGPRMDYIPRTDGEGVPRVLACFMAALLRDQPMKLVDGGSARRTIVAVEEAVEAIERMLDRPAQAQNRTFNIGNRNNEVTMRALAELMRDIYAEIVDDPRYRQHPIIDVSGEEFYGPGYEDCDRRMPDLSQANTLLGWYPKRNLREILLPTMRDYCERYADIRQWGEAAVEAS